MSIGLFSSQKNEVNACVSDVLRFTGYAIAIIGVVLSVAVGWKIGAAYFLGSLVSILNFLLLRYQLELLVKDYSPSVKRLFLPVIGGYAFRFLMMGIFLYLCGSYGGIVYLLSAGLGLLSVRIGIFIYSLIGKF